LYLIGISYNEVAFSASPHTHYDARGLSSVSRTKHGEASRIMTTSGFNWPLKYLAKEFQFKSNSACFQKGF